jgi:non-heme chloroperoxidase
MLEDIDQLELEVISREPRTGARSTPLLFVHGAFTAAWCWDEHFVPFFAQHGYSAHALSLRGHGASSGREFLSFASIENYVNDVARARARFARPPVMIGHSMGGIIVQKYLQTHAASAVVLMASVPPWGLLGPAMQLALKAPLFFQEINLIQYGERFQPSFSAVRKALFSPDVPDELVKKHVMRLQPESQRAIFDLSWHHLRYSQHKIHAPLLVLGAQNDVFFPPEMVELTAEAYDTRADIFPDMAHAMMLEPDWENVAKRVLAWLDALGL